jgi:hypothetical protein
MILCFPPFSVRCAGMADTSACCLQEPGFGGISPSATINLLSEQPVHSRRSPLSTLRPIGHHAPRPIVHRTKEFMPGDYIKRRSLEAASANINCRITVGPVFQDVPLARLLDQLTGAVALVYETDLTVPINSSRQPYPTDWYRATLPVYVDLPDTLGFRLNSGEYFSYFPQNIYLKRSDNLQDMRVTSATLPESLLPHPWDCTGRAHRGR